jgi:hypothetical protein
MTAPDPLPLPQAEIEIDAFMEAMSAATAEQQAEVVRLFEMNRDDEAAAVLGFVICAGEC